MAATLTLTCDQELADAKGRHACGFSQSFPYDFSRVETLSAVMDAGWRLVGDRLHCPTCAAADTSDMDWESL